MSMAHLAALFGTYGYAVLLAGTFLEGETVLVAAGYLAWRGYMDPALVILCAFAGSTLGDQTFFWIGRRHGQPWLQKRPQWRAKMSRVDALMARYGRLVLLGFRFIYGLRTITPFALGMSTLPFRTFAFYNVISALIWATIVGGAGYLFGSAMERFLKHLVHYEHIVIVGILLAGILIWLFRKRKEKR